MNARALSLIGAIVFVACQSGDRSSNSAPPSLDTPVAGDVVIDSAALATAPRWSTREVFPAGSRAGPVTFTRIRGLAAAPDGGALALDTKDQTVYRFDSTGRLLGRIGAPGPGPGEFRDASAMDVSGDTVFVAALRHLHAFALDGAVISTAEIQRPGAGEPIKSTWFLRRTPSGLIAGWPVLSRWPGGLGPTVDTMLFMRRDSSGLLRRVSALPVQEKFWIKRSTSFARVYSATPRYEVAPDGDVYYTPGDRYRIDVFDSNGTARSRIIGVVRPAPITDADIDRANKMSSRSGEAGPRPPPLSNLPEVKRAQFRAILGRIIRTDEGFVLVERLDLGPVARQPSFPRETVYDGWGPTIWDAVSRTRGLLGRVELPAGFLPSEVRNGRVYGIQVDSLDVQSLGVYQLIR